VTKILKNRSTGNLIWNSVRFVNTIEIQEEKASNFEMRLGRGETFLNGSATSSTPSEKKITLQSSTPIVSSL
jgi:hypothetical protein